METTSCGKSHQCADGGIGECTQGKGHFGRHLCRSCMAFFGGGDVIDSEPAGRKAGGSQADTEPGIAGSEEPPRVNPMDMCSECYARPATILCPYCWRYVCTECERWYPCSRAEKCGHCGKSMKMGDKSSCGKCNERIHLTCIKCRLDVD